MDKKKISLDDQLTLIKEIWKNPNKFKRKIILTKLGPSYYSIGFDKTNEEILAEVQTEKINQEKKPILNKIKRLFTST